MKHTIAFLISIIAVTTMYAGVRLPSVISDGMVIQRGQPILIWGWADSGEKFEVSWQDVSYPVEADENGNWQITFPAMNAGGPHTLKADTLEVKDILIGDVYLCSGQSNMELPVRRVTDLFAKEIAEYENNAIRQFIVPKVTDFNTEREDTPQASWTPCDQENVMEFSALAYFFAKEVHAKTKVPVGIVNASWGGTPIEAWMSERSLQAYPHYINEKQLYEDEGYMKRIKVMEGEHFHRWNSILYANDPGYHGQEPWFSESYNDRNWPEVDMFSKKWGNDGMNPRGGSHWLRKSFKVSRKMAGKEGILRLGCIVDADSVYVNGQFVGSTGYQYPPRIYRIPEGLLKEGENNITIRVVSNGGQPSFVPEKPYKIIIGKKDIKLEGKWKYRMGAPMPPAPSMMFFCYKPVCLYNAMISPLRNLRFSGVLWYQGESNVDRRNEYADLLTKMMQDWRMTFMAPNMPFYIVELAEFLHKDDKAGRAAWDYMREQQAKAAKENANAVLIKNKDLGEWNDIHPLDKKTLGKRAAKAAIDDLKKNN